MRIAYFACFILGLFLISCNPGGNRKGNPGVYPVRKLRTPICVDARWDKAAWQDASVLTIGNILGDLPRFIPETHVRMSYDKTHLYVIFRVADRYVKAINTEPNGPVWEDSCVELFFAPDSLKPMEYFNLEINCGLHAPIENSIVDFHQPGFFGELVFE